MLEGLNYRVMNETPYKTMNGNTLFLFKKLHCSITQNNYKPTVEWPSYFKQIQNTAHKCKISICVAKLYLQGYKLKYP